MSNCYKNFPVIITYGDSSADEVYGNSVNLSEGLNLQTALSLGVKGSSAVFNTEVPKGQINIDSYLTTDLSIFNTLKGNNDQDVSVQFGPYSAPSPSIMTSMSVSIKVGEPITVSRSFEYFGSLFVGASPAPSSPVLNPITSENIVLGGFSNIGNLENISSVDWSFSQSYKEYHLLGEVVPTIIFSEGQITINVEGEGLAGQLMTSTDSCVLPPKNYTISAFGCDDQSLGSLSIFGHMQERTSTVSSEQDEVNSASIIQYL